jgi:hypothetical protein
MKLKPGDRIRTIHPLSGANLEGVVKNVVNRSHAYDGETNIKPAFYALVSFDHSKDEWVAIELLEKISGRSIASSTKVTFMAQKITKGAQLEPAAGGQIPPVIELGTQAIESIAEKGVEVCASLTHLPPLVNGSIAVSSIYEGEPGKVEAKRVKGNIYYYLRRTGSRGQQESIYLAARWPKAIDVLARYCVTKPLEGMPF